MSKESIKTIRLNPDGQVFEIKSNQEEQLLIGQTQWKIVEALEEAEIERAALNDPDNPPLCEQELHSLSAIPNIKQIRNQLQLSQRQFAQKFQLSLKTVQDWEQGRSQPDQAARILLRVIAVNPEAVTEALAVKL
jgi:putative transcriptional regulator